MAQHQIQPAVPLILAPAGNRPAFLAAIAAGADAVYCGLKELSARMGAVNFTLEELAALAGLARDNGVKVHVTLNSMLRPTEIAAAGNLVARLSHHVRPDALIIQDLAFVPLARQAGFKGQLHLSTLANVSFGRALAMVHRQLGVDRVVLPRELNIDEIKAMAAACPDGLGLELFVHGALCFGVSGRCYWSSYMGGKSGLRGRCVQPCRRRYTVAGGQQSGRYFSCQDLSLDVLGKVLLSIPQLHAWKIEGRRKGPHYVYYTVQAYRMIRDEGQNPQARKAALELLDQALGRPGTHYNFLPQRPQSPVDADKQTGSGMLIGKCQGPRNSPYIIPREPLFAGDLLRTGYEDDPWHSLHKVKQSVPKRGRYYLKVAPGKGPETGTPVFLVDRLEHALAEKIKALESELPPVALPIDLPEKRFSSAERRRKRHEVREMMVFRQPGPAPVNTLIGAWLSAEAIEAVRKDQRVDVFWWLPPVVWPAHEEALIQLIDRVIRDGARHFVLNAPWQIAFFSPAAQYDFWAGPFCNVSNPPGIDLLRSMGFSGVLVTPELGEKELLLLPEHSSLSIGMVISGHWPLCVSRGVSNAFHYGSAYVSPKGEQAWVQRHGPDNWVFPNWKIDLSEKKGRLKQAGFEMFVHLQEPVPTGISLKQRPGLWNWEVGLQ
ncbi:MAG: peptidase U32 family protein [Desulfobacterales bacterium]|jgi:putative protease|nr:peptidase U32 family protein [Desulfobacterales bacterium]